MLGYSREEMIGRPVFDFVAEDFKEVARTAVLEKIRGTDDVTTEMDDIIAAAQEASQVSVC